MLFSVMVYVCSCLGRGVFSCTEFNQGDFLLEYRGDLINKEECEQSVSGGREFIMTP